MAFFTVIPLRSSSLAIAKFPNNGCQQLKDLRSSPALCTRLESSTCNITTSDQLKQASHPLKPYKSFCDNMNRIISEEDNHVTQSRLVKRVQRLISKVNDERFEDLIMVDALQRLEIDHYFMDEIRLILRRRYLQFINVDSFNHQSLYEVSLYFRILRQNGFYVSTDVFKIFLGNNDKFEENLNMDIIGLLALYEASHLRVEGEAILEEAEIFSYQCLNEAMSFLEDEQVRMVKQILENPYHNTISFLTCKNSINDYNGTVLQELAEVNFKFKQTAHQKEVNEILRWWKDLGLCQELVHARDQPLKWYLWPMVALTAPDLSTQRIDLTKIISLIYVIDDIFDVYGNIHELTAFTEAIKRCDRNATEELPYHMKSSFKAVYDFTGEIAYKVYQKHGYNPINALWQSWENLCNAFLVEAKWFASGHIPNVNEYMKIATASSGIQVVLLHLFFLVGDGTTEEHASLINDNDGIISSVSTILRLWDDLGNAQDENQDGYDGSYIDCFLKDHEGSSIKIAREHVTKLISDTWKRLNKECLSPNPFSATFVKVSNNIARMVPLMYTYDDNSALPLLNNYVKALLLEESKALTLVS